MAVNYSLFFRLLTLPQNKFHLLFPFIFINIQSHNINSDNVALDKTHSLDIKTKILIHGQFFHVTFMWK